MNCRSSRMSALAFVTLPLSMIGIAIAVVPAEADVQALRGMKTMLVP